MPEQYCPECDCITGDKIYESEGVLYCCESCANGDACECENCAQIVEEDEDEEKLCKKDNFEEPGLIESALLPDSFVRNQLVLFRYRAASKTFNPVGLDPTQFLEVPCQVSG